MNINQSESVKYTKVHSCKEYYASKNEVLL